MPKISELNAVSNTSTSDLMVLVKDINGAPSTNKIPVGTFMTFASRMGAYATNTQLGGIKVGNNLTINATGFLNAPGNANTGDIRFSNSLITTIDTNAEIEIRTDDHSIQLAPNNYVWDFSPQGFLNVPTGAQIKFSDNTIITSITGPFVNDAAASSGGVALKSLYYDSSGNVKIRLT